MDPVCVWVHGLSMSAGVTRSANHNLSECPHLPMVKSAFMCVLNWRLHIQYITLPCVLLFFIDVYMYACIAPSCTNYWSSSVSRWCVKYCTECEQWTQQVGVWMDSVFCWCNLMQYFSFSWLFKPRWEGMYLSACIHTGHCLGLVQGSWGSVGKDSMGGEWCMAPTYLVGW